jgi:hypothetical protein
MSYIVISCNFSDKLQLLIHVLLKGYKKHRHRFWKKITCIMAFPIVGSCEFLWHHNSSSIFLFCFFALEVISNQISLLIQLTVSWMLGLIYSVSVTKTIGLIILHLFIGYDASYTRVLDCRCRVIFNELLK